MFEIQNDKVKGILRVLSLGKAVETSKTLDGAPPPPPRHGLKRLEPLKRAFKAVFCLSLLTFACLPAYFATCTPAEKAKMVKLGMETADIQAACPELESEEKTETQVEGKQIIINVNQQQKQKQEQNDASASAAQSPRSEPKEKSHEPENFFWEFGAGFSTVSTEIEGTSFEGKASELPFSFFPFSYFFDSLAEGSLGVGMDWLNQMLIEFDTEETSQTVYTTQRFNLHYVLKHSNGLIFIPYFGYGTGKAIFLGGYKADVEVFGHSCDISNGQEKLTVNSLGVKAVAEEAYTEGGGFLVNLVYDRYGPFEISCKDDGRTTAKRKVSGASGFKLTFGYMW